MIRPIITFRSRASGTPGGPGRRSRLLLVAAVVGLLLSVLSGTGPTGAEVVTLPSGKLAWNSYFGSYPNVPTYSVPNRPIGDGTSTRDVPGGLVTINGPVRFNVPFRVQFTPQDSADWKAYDPAAQVYVSGPALTPPAQLAGPPGSVYAPR